MLRVEHRSRRELIVAAVGELQLDVAHARLQREFAAEAAVERLPYTCARWLEGVPERLAAIVWPSSALRALDEDGRQVGLFRSIDDVVICRERNPEIRFTEISDHEGAITDPVDHRSHRRS